MSDTENEITFMREKFKEQDAELQRLRAFEKLVLSIPEAVKILEEKAAIKFEASTSELKNGVSNKDVRDV